MNNADNLTEDQNFIIEDDYSEDEIIDEYSVEGDIPEDPSFPIFILMAAILKDFIDILDFTFLGIIVSSVATFILTLIIFLWMLGKLNFYQKALLRWFWKRFIVIMFIEYIPFLSIVPGMTFLVLIAHYREKKIVREFLMILEILEKRGLIKLNT